MAASMLLPQNSISIVRGTSKTLQVTVTKADGTYYDITGGKLVFTVKRALYEDVPLIQKLTTDAAQGVLTKPREGIAEFYLEPRDTNGLNPQNYIFDVWLITATGDRYVVVAEAVLAITPGVTYLPT